MDKLNRDEIKNIIINYVENMPFKLSVKTICTNINNLYDNIDKETLMNTIEFLEYENILGYENSVYKNTNYKTLYVVKE